MRSMGISLSQWIEGALLESIDANNSNQEHAVGGAHHDSRKQALSSDSFLSSALKVARSLGDQVVCRARTHQDQEEEDTIADRLGPPSSLPPSGSINWADGVTVHLSSSSSYDKNNNDNDKYNQEYLQPLPLSPDGEPSTCPGELRDMLKSVIGDVSLLEKDDEYHNEQVEGEDSKKPPLNYLSVDCANFGGGSNNTSCDRVKSRQQDEMQRIYSLGLVFYELFSGGEKPEIIASNGKSHEGKEEEPGLLEDTSRPNGFNGPIDISGNLNLDPSLPNGKHKRGRQAGPIDISRNLNLDDDDSDVEDLVLPNGKHNTDGHEREGLTEKKKASKGILSSANNLKSKGIPWTLCDMISNMVDCANGDLSDNEAYCRMSDVCDDLQRMLDKPRIYLDDLDLAKLSVTGLQLHNSLFGRENEFATLTATYQRSIATGGNEMVLITGTSGIGKSILAHRLGSFVTTGGGIFLSGKFDQLQQATPFSAIASAFNQYCNMLTNERQSTRACNVASELNRVLGTEAFHLSKVIPGLGAFIGRDVDGYGGIDQGCVDPQKRLLYLMCQFVEVISSSSGAPVTLFLDDLQWADPASIEVIHQLLLISGSLNKSKQFFFLGCVREEEVGGDHPFLGMLPSVCQFGTKVSTINLSCMDEGTIHTLISEVLCLSPRLTRTLGNIIHHKTKGNHLFFSQLMIALNREGLLCLSLSRRRWAWDEQKIQSRKIEDDVATFMTSNIGRLSLTIRRAISLLSCFGASTKITLVEVLGAQLGMTLIESLEEAVAEGVLDKVDGSYSFGHDRLQEAAYGMMRPEERCLFHFEYGVALVACSLGSYDDDLLFTATTQLNRGGPSAVENAEQAVLVANLNLTAGKKAMEMSDFSSAYNFFDNGISFLQRRHWTEHYELSLGLYDNAAKCALFIGNIISLKYLSQQVLTFAKSFEDTLEVLFITVSALAKCDPPQAISKALSILPHLGEEFSNSYSESDTKMFIEQTKVVLQGFSEQQLIEYKTMDDQSKIIAMKYLAKLELLTQLARPSWQPIVTLKMVQLSLTHGMSPQSAIAFTYYGMLIARLGSIREGYSYVKIGRKLLERAGYNEVAGEVISMGTQVMCFVEPVQSANEFFLQGHAAAMSSGDMSNAIMSSFMYAIGSYWAGIKLHIVREKFTTSRSLMEKQNNLMWLAHQRPLERSMLMLIGTDERDLPEPDELGKISVQAAQLIYFNKVYQTFMFREYDKMKGFAEKYFSYNLNSWSLVYIHTAQAFMGGLAAFWVSRKSNDPVWAERGCKSKFQMKKWADSCQWNFQSKLYLMEAEEAFCYKDIEGAKSLYEKAISSAKEHRFINEEALAYELAAYFFMEIGQNETSVSYFLQAHEKYHDWGAMAKANAVYAFTMASMSGSALLTSQP